MSITTPAVDLFSQKQQLIPGEGEKEIYFLVTDTRDYYQDIVKTNALTENVVWASPDHLTTTPADEIYHMLKPVSAVLIDWSIRNARLLNLLRNNRRDQSIPIVALCGAQEADHVTALIMGADETINRLLNPIMLKAKLVAYGRSIEEKRSKSKIEARIQDVPLFSGQDYQAGVFSELQIGPLSIDLAARSFWVEDNPVQLTPIEYNLMELLVTHAGSCIRRDDIINQVWGIDYETGTNFLDVHIHALRQKLKNAGAPPCIFTIRGVGYRLDSGV